MAENFTLVEHFNVKPERIYQAWIDGKTHGHMTGAPAESEPRVGGTFTAWDGYIAGTYLALEPNRLLSMTWRTDEFAPSDPDSRVEITLSADGTGAILTLNHNNLPTGTAQEYEEGWRDYYFVPMQQYFS